MLYARRVCKTVTKRVPRNALFFHHSVGNEKKWNNVYRFNEMVLTDIFARILQKKKKKVSSPLRSRRRTTATRRIHRRHDVAFSEVISCHAFFNSSELMDLKDCQAPLNGAQEISGDNASVNIQWAHLCKIEKASWFC